jgi:hypothetical protein
MNYKYGNFVVGNSTIDSGSPASVLNEVLTAGDKPVSIQFAQAYGGDAGLFIGIFLVPPNAIDPNSETLPSGVVGSIAITSAQYLPGGRTQDIPYTFSSDSGGRGNGINGAFVIPPYWGVWVAQDGSAGADWVVTCGGFELVD